MGLVVDNRACQQSRSSSSTSRNDSPHSQCAAKAVVPALEPPLAWLRLKHHVIRSRTLSRARRQRGVASPAEPAGVLAEP